MDAGTRRTLNAINRRFYEAEARAFSDTRDHPWPGWERLLPLLSPAAPVRLLDVGCGNGRFLDFLRDRGVDVDYTGIDASPGLLEIARDRHADGSWVEFDFVEAPPSSLPPGPFDLVTLFGVMHHVPGEAERVDLLRALAGRLAPGGHLVFTTWQFARDPRFVKKLRKVEGIDPRQLEPGDHGVAWGDAADVRYCHDADADERARWIASLDLETIDRYEADGRSGELNHYTVLRKRNTN